MNTEIEIFGGCHSSCYIGRKLTADSAKYLACRHSLPNYFIGCDIKPKFNKNMSVSLLERVEIQRARDLHKEIGCLAARDLIPKILEPMPESALKQLNLNVMDVDFYNSRLGKTCLVLVLDDPNNVLQTERQLFADRLSKDINWRHSQPHLTIAKLSGEFPKSEIKEWILGRHLKTISVEPVTAKGIVLPGYALSN